MTLSDETNECVPLCVCVCVCACVCVCVCVCVCEGGSRVYLGEEGLLELHNPGNQARGSSVGGPGVRVERARVPGREPTKKASEWLCGSAG